MSEPDFTDPPSGFPAARGAVDFSATTSLGLSWLVTFVSEIKTALTWLSARVSEVSTDATSAATSEANAAASAFASAVTAGAFPFEAGDYSENTVAISQVDFRSYRVASTGSYTTDPANDPDNWIRVGASGLPVLADLLAPPTISQDWTVGIASEIGSELTYSRASAGSRINEIGALEDVAVDTPRFDYDTTTLKSNGLILEDAATNAFVNEPSGVDAFDATGSSTVSTHTDIETPDGTTGRVVTRISGADTLSNRAEKSHTSAAASNEEVWTGSAYVRAVSGVVTGRLQVADGGSFVGSNDFSVGSDWERVSATMSTGTPGSTNRLLQFYNCSGDIEVCFCDLVAAPTESSHIFTTTASATRSAGSVEVSGSDYSARFAKRACTLVMTMTPFQNTNEFPRIIEMDSASTDFLFLGLSTTDLRFRVQISGSTEVSIDTPLTSGQEIKVAFSFDDGTARLAVDGVEIGSGALSRAPDLNQLKIAGAGVRAPNMKCKGISIYPTALTSAQMKEITRA